MPDLRQVLQDYEQRFRAQVDQFTANVRDLQQRGAAAIKRADGQATALDGRLKPLEQALPQTETALTSIQTHLAAIDVELQKLDPTYVPPTG